MRKLIIGVVTFALVFGFFLLQEILETNQKSELGGVDLPYNIAGTFGYSIGPFIIVYIIVASIDSFILGLKWKDK